MSFITVAGETQLAVKQGAGQPLNITHFVLANITGLGAEPANRIEAMPAAGDIVADLAVTKNGYVNGNQVVYSLNMDSTVGDFDFNWIGLKDDENVLIAVAYIPTTSKTKTVGNVPGNNMTRNFLLAFSGITATTAISVPAETWQIDFTARLLGIDERERLSNLDIYDAAAFFGSGWQVVRQGTTTTYDVLPGIGYVGGIRINNTATQTVAVASPPKAVWLDVSLQGDISNVNAVVAIIADANAHPNYTDVNGFNHYLTKIADIAANGVVTDLRLEADHEAKSDPHSQYLTEEEGNALYDPLGGLAAHAAASDPHSQYLTKEEGDATYKDLSEVTIPTATIIPVANYTAPTGFLICNGAEISRSTYSTLFDFIGTIYGQGDGSTTFTLPDLRGQFQRGLDNGRGLDLGRIIGSTQQGSLLTYDKSFNSGVQAARADDVSADNAGAFGADSNNAGNYGATINEAGVSANPAALGTNSIIGMARPTNIALLYVIKY